MFNSGKGAHFRIYNFPETKNRERQKGLAQSHKSRGHGHGRSASCVAWQFSKHQGALGESMMEETFLKTTFLDGLDIPPTDAIVANECK